MFTALREKVFFEKYRSLEIKRSVNRNFTNLNRLNFRFVQCWDFMMYRNWRCHNSIINEQSAYVFSSITLV